MDLDSAVPASLFLCPIITCPSVESSMGGGSASPHPENLSSDSDSFDEEVVKIAEWIHHPSQVVAETVLSCEEFVFDGRCDASRAKRIPSKKCEAVNQPSVSYEC